MDRAVLNEANLKNANLERAVFTRYSYTASCVCVCSCLSLSDWHRCLSCRSDLSDADIEGADFSNALLDKTMQTVRHWSVTWSSNNPTYTAADGAPCACRSSAGTPRARTQSPAWRRGPALVAAANGGSARAFPATRRARRWRRKKRRSSGAQCPRMAALASRIEHGLP